MKRHLLRINISKVICVFIFSFAFFYIFSVRFRIVTIVTIAVMALLSTVSYRNRKHTFPKSAGFFIAILFAYSMEYIAVKHDLLQIDVISAIHFVTGRMELFDVVLCAGIVAFLLYSIRLIFHKKIIAPETVRILNEQKYDIERLEHYVSNFNITGINGVWGSGKTFLTEEFKRRNQNNYTFITIGLLHCNLDEILGKLLEELDKVLLENGILSLYSHKLKIALANSGIAEKISSIFIENSSSQASVLEDFKKEFTAVIKTIVIVLEDIDRISDDDGSVTKMIFSLSELLSCKAIKFLYQYDQGELNKKDLPRAYTEKYIPYVVNVTPVDFSILLNHLCRELKIDNKLIDIGEDFKFTRLPVYPQLPYYLTVEQQISISIQVRCESIRKVEQFLTELEHSLKENTEYRKPKNKNVVISFFFLKHFHNTLYEKIRMSTSLIDTFTLKYKDQEYTLFELLALCKNATESNMLDILTSPENKDIFGLLCLFGYNFDMNEELQGFDIFSREPKEHMSIRNSNEKIDRLIWNLYASGTTEFTDCENAVREMERMVLGKPTEDQKVAFEEFFTKFYNEDMEKSGNNSVFRFGIPAFVSLFHAFSVVCNNVESWQKLVALYFETHRPDITIDSELISILNDCRVDYKELYLNLVRRFIDIPIVGNLYRLKSYRKFLESYLGAISRLGYIDTSDLRTWLGISSMFEKDNQQEGEEETMKILHDETLPGMKSKLIRLKDAIATLSPSAYDDIEYLIRFIDKNIEIINCEMYIKSPEPHFNTNVSSRYINQEEFDRLCDLAKDSLEGYKKEIDKSYRLSKITAQEISKLPPYESSV